MTLNDLKKLSKDDVLAALGLQSRQSTTSAVLGSLGLLSLGFLIGAGTALMVAPKAGRELREDLNNRLNGTTRRVADRVRDELNAAREP